MLRILWCYKLCNMKLDCPYFNFSEIFPFHNELIRKYERLLSRYGIEFYVRDTDHSYDCLRWHVSMPPIEFKQDVDLILKQFVTEFYSTCMRCGERYVSEPSYYQDSLYDGFFPDEGLYCSVCKIKNVLSSYEVDLRFILDHYFSAVENNQADVINYLGKRKIKFRTQDGRYSFCRLKDIVKQDRTFYLLAPTRPEYDSSENDGYQGTLAKGFSATEIFPYAYDMGIRDIYGKRIYSSYTGCILMDNSILSFDAQALPAMFEDLDKIKNCPIIVKGDPGAGEKYIDDDYYRMSYEDFQSRLSKLK